MKVLRTGAILILLSVVLVVAGGAIGGRGGMQIALVIAVVMNLLPTFSRTRSLWHPAARSRFRGNSCHDSMR